MAVRIDFPEAPVISAAASAAGMADGLGASDAGVFIGSKSMEWPIAPFTSAATGGANLPLVEKIVAPAPPDPASPSTFAAASIEGVDSASCAARTAMPMKSAVRCLARSITDDGMSS